MTLAKLMRRPTLFLASCPSGFHMYLICACLSLAGCDKGSKGPDPRSQPNLADLLDLVVEKRDNADKEGVISLKAVLINKSSREVEVYITGKVYQFLGGFEVYHDTKVHTPQFRLSGTTKYNELPPNFGLLAGHGRTEFDLLLELPRDEANAVLADPGSVRVVLVIPRIRRDGSYTELLEKRAELLGHWKQSVQGTSKPGLRGG